jgi:hypothetical protein
MSAKSAPDLRYIARAAEEYPSKREMFCDTCHSPRVLADLCENAVAAV